MDEKLELATRLANEIRRNYKESNALDETGLAIRLIDAGYRLDPYPNGKNKQELVDIIAQKHDALTKCRIMLSEEHTRHVEESYGTTMEHHRRIDPDCRYCRFVAEHSLVKS